MPSKKPQLNLRVDPALRERLVTFARVREMSLNLAGEIALSRGLDVLAQVGPSQPEPAGRLLGRDEPALPEAWPGKRSYSPDPKS